MTRVKTAQYWYDVIMMSTVTEKKNKQKPTLAKINEIKTVTKKLKLDIAKEIDVIKLVTKKIEVG